MRLIALFMALSFLAACGKEEAHDHDHDHHHGADKAPVTGVEKTAGDAPSGGAEMKTVTLDVTGMT